MFAQDISEDFSDFTFTGFYSISGYLRNIRGRLLSSERFLEVFTLWVFTLKPFPAHCDTLRHFVTLYDTLRHFLPRCSDRHKLVIKSHGVSSSVFKMRGTVVLKLS